MANTIHTLQYIYPAIAFIYFVSATVSSICMRQAVALKTKDQAVRRDIILALISAVAIVCGLYVGPSSK
jgi:hypothetical protein